MNESVKTMLHERAESVAFRPPDLWAVKAAGDRRIRGRRLASVLAGAAAVAVIAGSVVVFGRPNDPPPVISPWPSNAVTWAIGSTIHIGSETVEVGHTVRALVRTAAGFATIDDANHVYSVTADGVRRIGDATPAPPFDSDVGDDQARLVSDPRGTLVGWVGAGTDWLNLQTYDQATGRHRSYPAIGATPPGGAVFHAIDGRTGYWRTPGGVYEVDLDSGEQRLLTMELRSYAFEMYSARNGMLAFRVDDSILAGRSIDNAELLIRFGEEELRLLTPPYRLSPTGDWLSLGVHDIEKLPGGDFRGVEDRAEVYNTSNGEHVVLDVLRDAPKDSALGIPVDWLDDVTVQVVGIHADEPFANEPTAVRLTMYACTVPDGSCRLAADLGTIEVNEQVPPNFPVLPDGRGSST
jgi:hypothetical protein